jgi:DNA-binding beta-propeller fold protein YncE
MASRLRGSFGAGILAGLTFATIAGTSAAADSPPNYRLTNTIALGAPDRWDYLYFDVSAKRVYISHGNEVTVVDGRSGAIIGNVANLPGSHGMAVSAALKRGVADSATNQQVTFFDSDTLKPLGTAKSGEDADGIAFDAKTGRAFVANGDGQALTAVDMANGRFVGTLALGGAPEFLVSDGAGHVFVNLESTREIVNVDAKALAVTARYAIPDCEKPHGIAIDKVTRRLFTSCVNEKLVVVDADSGKLIATLPIGKYTDAAAFDPKRKLAFSSNGEGNVTIIAEKSANDFAIAGTLVTVKGAKTMTLDPETGRLYLVSAEIDHVDPPTSPGGHPHAVYKPGTVRLYIYDPVK